MNKPLRTLVIEDSEDNAFFVLRTLRAGGFEPDSLRVETEGAFKSALKDREWDLVIADYSLPRFNALEALRLLQNTGLDLPFIIVSGAIGEEVAVAAMKSGAHDYILKSNLARLVPAVERELREAHERLERKRAETSIAALSKLGQNLSSASTPREAAYVIANLVDELFGWDAFSLEQCSAHANTIRTLLNVDTIDGQRQEVPPLHTDGPPDALTRRVIEHGAELILRDEPDGPLPGKTPFGDVSRPAASLMFAPIRNQIRVLGILSLQSRRPRAYERRDLATLQTMADYCGGALERIRAREALRESEERYRKLSDAAPVGIFENDAEGRNTYTNPRWTLISGFTREESLGWGWIKAVHPEDRPEVEASWRQAVAEGRDWAYEHRLLTPQGMVRWVKAQAAVMTGQDGRYSGHVGTIEDITRSKKAADALRSAQERLQHLVSSSPAVLYALKVNGDLLLPTWVSENIAQMTGYGPEETLSAQWWTEHLNLTHGLAGLHENSSHNTLLEEYAFRRKDGTDLWLRDERRLLRNAAGQLVEIVGSWSDITQRRLAEEELRASREQLRALAARLQSVREEEQKRIAREIHDELGQSLTGFKMDLAWIRNRLQADGGPPAIPPLLEKIATMGKLLDGTAGLMRKMCTELRPGVLDDLGLIPALEWQAREFQKRTGIECPLRVDAADVQVDPDRSTAIFRIFQEILTNVARHSGAKRVEARLHQSDTHLFLEVKDDGRGIKDHEKAGTKSLGLVGLRERAIIFGGEVSIEGKSGKGTAMKVKIPLPPNTTEDPDRENTSGAAELPPTTVAGATN